jgi:outer membrane protein assembly factor BamB
MSFENLVFVGFNSHVLALDRDSGDIVWSWQAPKPKNAGYVTLLLDGDRLIISVNGYMYCLEPETGDLLWNNETKGFGTGIASIVSVRGQSSHDVLAGAAAAEAQSQAAAASSVATM